MLVLLAAAAPVDVAAAVARAAVAVVVTAVFFAVAVVAFIVSLPFRFFEVPQEDLRSKRGHFLIFWLFRSERFLRPRHIFS